MSLMSILVTLGLACVASVNAWHRVCDGGMEPDPQYLATSNDKGPLETAVQRTDSRYWWHKDGSFEPDEQVELIAPLNEDGVDTVIKLCRPWDEGGCAKCPAILAFDDNASKLVNGVYYYSKLPTLDWLYANGYTPADLRRDPNRPDRFKICVRSYWVERPEVCSGDLHEDCRGYFRATCRKAPLPGGGPDGDIFDNGDPARNGNRKLL